MKKLFQKLTTWLLLTAFLFTMLPETTLLAAEKSENEKMVDQMVKTTEDALAAEGDDLKTEYPNGIYSFATLTSEIDENAGDPLTVFLVRHGGSEGEQTLHFSIADYTAQYGKDYYVKLSESFFSKKLEENEDSKPILYQFEDKDDAGAPDEAELREEYGDEVADEILSLIGANGEESVENPKGAANDDDTEETEAKETETVSANAIEPETETASETESPSETEAEPETEADVTLASGESTAAAQAKRDETTKSAVKSPLALLNEDTSQYTDTGVGLDMEEVALSEEQEVSAEKNAKLLDLILPGTEGDITFKDGEQIKAFYVYSLDNEISDGNRVFEIRLSASQEEENISWQPGENSAVVTIKDDEPDETAVISAPTEPVTIAADGTAEVVLSRADALYKISTVDYVVSDAKGSSVLASGKAVFMPGMDERTVRLSVSNVTSETSDKLTLSLKSPTGAELSEQTTTELSLTDYKEAHEEELALAYGDGANGVYYSGGGQYRYVGTKYLGYYDVELSSKNFSFRNHVCDDMDISYGFKDLDGNGTSDLEMDIPDWYSGSGTWIVAEAPNWGPNFTSTPGLLMVMLDSAEIDWCWNDYDNLNRNRVAFSTGSSSWSGSESSASKLMMTSDEHKDRMTSKINFLTGGLSNIPHTIDYNDSYMNYVDKFKNGNIYISNELPRVAFGVKKNSGWQCGMNLKVYGLRFNFRKYQIVLDEPRSVGKHDNLPGLIKFSSGKTVEDHYAGETLTFQPSTQEEWAKLTGFNISADGKHWQTIMSDWYSAEAMTIDLCPMLFASAAEEGLDMDGKSEFCYGVDYPNGIIHIRPVYEQIEVPVKVIADEHAGMEISCENAQSAWMDGPTSYYVEPGETKTIKMYVDQTITVKPYHVDSGSIRENWKFKDYVLTPTEINGSGEVKQIVDSNETAQLKIDDYNYTLINRYDHTGMTVNINMTGAAGGCGLIETMTDAAGNEVPKTLYTYDDDKLYGGKILGIRAKVADGYRAKWTNQTVGHEDYKTVCYGDTYYFEIETTTSNIDLTFEKVDDLRYTEVFGEIGSFDNSIIYPPSSDMISDWSGKRNVVVEMGEFTAFSDENGSYRLYSHTEASEDENGESVDGDNVTTYFKMGSQTEKHTILAVQNGIQELYYVDITPKSGSGSTTDTPATAEASKVTLDFYGSGPIPTDFYVLLGDEDKGNLPYQANRSPTIDLLNYTVGFHTTIDQAVDADGNDLVDRVKYTVFDKNGTQRTTYSMDRDQTVSHQTEYEMITYSTTDSNGAPTQMILNALLNFESGDEVYVELINLEYDQYGNEAEVSWGMYRSGISFLTVPGKGIELYLPEVEPTGGEASGLPTVDVLGSMLPSINYGRLNVGVTPSSDALLINIGFDVGKLNASLYDSDASKAEPTDPLDPFDDFEYADDVEADFTPDEITNPPASTVNAYVEDDESPTNPFAAPAREKVEKLKSQAKDLGIGQPKGQSVRGKGSISANLGFSLGLSLRFVIKNNEETGIGEWCFDYALVYGQVSGGVSGVYYMIFPEFPIPVYAGASFTASVGLYNGIAALADARLPITDFNENGVPSTSVTNGLVYEGTVPITLGIEGFLGTGIRNLLSAEFGLGFLQKFNFAWYESDDGMSRQTGTGKSSFYGYLGVALLFFNYKWQFMQVNWDYTLYDNVSVNDAIKANMNPQDVALTELGVTTPATVHYYDETPTNVTGSSKWDGTTKIADGLTDTNSAIVSLGDGAYLVAFEGALSDSDRTSAITDANYAYNSRAIYLTFFDGTSATTRILQKDGHFDMGLAMRDVGDRIVISWSSADKTFEASDLFENGSLKDTAVAEVLSSVDLYAVVLEKSEVVDFVSSSPEQKLEQIERLTDDKTAAKNTTLIDEALAEGADFLGYGYENGHAVRIGSQIYLFFTAADYNQWKGEDKISSLSDLLDVDGYELYRIYDIETGQWTEDYGDSTIKQAIENRGFTLGERLADIHLTTTGATASTMLPAIGEFDASTMSIKGEEKIVVSYLVEGDQKLSNNSGTAGETASKQLYLTFLTPAEITGGKITKEPVWTMPLAVNTDYAIMHLPTMRRLAGGDTYLLFSENRDLNYINLTDWFETTVDELRSNKKFESIKTTTQKVGKNKITKYELAKGTVAPVTTAIIGDEDNGFSYRNGYRIATDGNDHIYVIWAQSEGSSQKLYLSAMSVDENGYETWSTPAPMDWESGNPDDERYYLESPSIAVGVDGNMLIAHNAYDLVTETAKNSAGQEVAIGRTHTNDRFSLTRQKAIGSAAITDFALSHTYPQAGSDFTAEATVENDGFLTAKELTVEASFLKVAANGDETVLQSATPQVFTEQHPKATQVVSFPFTMEQSYIDDAVATGATYYVEVKTYEAGYESDAATERAQVYVGADYQFTDVAAKGFDGENGSRYLLHATIANVGNLASEETGYSVVVSNEGRFATTGSAWDGSTLKSGLTTAEMKAALRHDKSMVVKNENYRDWLSTGSTLLGEASDTIGIGESVSVWLLSNEIGDDLFSANDALTIAFATQDKKYSANASIESRNASMLAVKKAEPMKTQLVLRSHQETVDALTLTKGTSEKLQAMVLPLKDALTHRVSWSTDRDEIASVDADGTVHANASGTVNITAAIMLSDGSTVSQTCAVTVSDPTPGLTVNGLKNPVAYTGSAIKPGQSGQPALFVTYSGETLTYGTDYTLSYKNTTKVAASTAKKAPTVTVKLKGAYKKLAKQEKLSNKAIYKFSIEKKSLSDGDIVMNPATGVTKTKTKKGVVTYQKRKLSPTIYYNGKKLKKNKDYTLNYEDSSTDAYAGDGRWLITATGKGNYTGTLATYEILRNKGELVDFSKAKATLAEGETIAVYNAEHPVAQTPKYVLTVTQGGETKTLTEGIDYTVTYLNNTKPGKATVTFTATEVSTAVRGTKKVTFKIPKK